MISQYPDPQALRVRCGLPHPLHNFAGPNFVDGFLADILVDFILDTVRYEPISMAWKGAVWFLLESERAYPYACDMAGIDAEKLRRHLRNKIVHE